MTENHHISIIIHFFFFLFQFKYKNIKTTKRLIKLFKRTLQFPLMTANSQPPVSVPNNEQHVPSKVCVATMLEHDSSVRNRSGEGFESITSCNP